MNNRAITKVRRVISRLQARCTTWRNIDDVIDRRAQVEQYLFDCTGGQRPLPDAETCRLMALKLGTPTHIRNVKLPIKR